MPLLKSFGHFHYRVALWGITEREEELTALLALSAAERLRLRGMANGQRRLEYLAARCALRQLCPQPAQLAYQPNGKPYLLNLPGHISLSHTRSYAAAAYSLFAPVGVDLEGYRPGILRIARKFLRKEEALAISETQRLEHLTAYWGAKEAAVKVCGDRRLDFKRQIRVAPFSPSGFASSTGLLVREREPEQLHFHFFTWPEIHLTVAWCKEKNPRQKGGF